ncbi:hypothetical protein E2562_025379 [Oryza meyeriana var. granulata]|uniref:Uncharacterized protein n=1 Tax=Oryza meyeriana var. granulata TaxID=110450 RepID=A0A6G1DMW6_9ORYZ|nr:hypothetical protein E2562_025379 [Oryza meyeriana var. granulata]
MVVNIVDGECSKQKLDEVDDLPSAGVKEDSKVTCSHYGEVHKRHPTNVPCFRCGIIHRNYTLTAWIYGLEEFNCKVLLPGIEDSDDNQRAIVATGGTYVVEPHVLEALDRKRAWTELIDDDIEHKQTLVDLVDGKENNQKLDEANDLPWFVPDSEDNQSAMVATDKTYIPCFLVDGTIAENDAE